MTKTVNGNTVVSIQAVHIQIEQWMLREAEEWDRVHNSGPWPGRVTPDIPT